MKIHNKIFLYQLLFFLISSTLYTSEASQKEFDKWLITYKKYALQKGVSQNTIDLAFKDVKFLEKVIGYDRKQPEFYEDTITYINKRANKSRLKKANKLLKQNKKLFNDIENNFLVEKELLLSLWGIETNFGTYVGKMDIISSLATLSYDKRRSKFFSSELLTLLKLIDDEIIDHNKLFGSWAGAYGNFQFMPSTIKKYINSSARSISNRLSISKWKKYGVIKFDVSEFKTNLKAALIVPDGKINSPAFLVFANYEKILKWNRSLRFGISVCTLANMIKA